MKTPTPAVTDQVTEKVAEPAAVTAEQPQIGGSFVRQPDGSLARDGKEHKNELFRRKQQQDTKA